MSIKLGTTNIAGMPDISGKANTSLNNLDATGQAILDAKASTDLDNLTSTGKNIGNWSSNVSNCITYIPQDIKLELNNGTLTLKAGSKLYVPNWFESDGTTQKFDTITTSSDLTLGTVGTATAQSLMYVHSDGSALSLAVDNTSGTTAPSGSGMWYDTSTNLVKQYTSGSPTGVNCSLPIALASRTSGSWTSIDQVFNGFGYIGSTVFALPGVKGLFCNGKNTDGTSSSTPFELSNVLVNNTFNNNATSYFVITRDLTIARSQASGTSYDEVNNWIYRSDGLYKNGMIAGILESTTSGIQWFNPKTPFHALDWNDSSDVSGWSMPSNKYTDLTLGASGSTYTAPANGWFYLTKSSNAVNQYIEIGDSTDGIPGIRARVYNPLSSGTNEIYIPAKKGHKIYIVYTAGGAVGNFKFVYAEGENV